MNQTLLTQFGNSFERVENALNALRKGKGVLVTDDERRENEGDLIFPAQSITETQMAMMIRECSGIVCLCLTEEKVSALKLPMMVENNSCRFRTAYTVSIDGAEEVTTGVSAHDRVTTIRTAVADNANPEHLHRPGHIFPLKSRPGGVLERSGHTEATVDLIRSGRTQALWRIMRAYQCRRDNGAPSSDSGFCPDARFPCAYGGGSQGLP